MSAHELKTWPIFFEAILNRKKTFELRKNDRDFKDGDTLLLREWDPSTGENTGRWAVCDVTYIIDSDVAFGVGSLKEGYCVMAIKVHKVGVGR